MKAAGEGKKQYLSRSAVCRDGEKKKKRKKFVRYGVCAVVILAVCAVLLTLLYLRRRRKKTGSEAVGSQTAKRKAPGKDAAKRRTAESEAAGSRTANRETDAEETAGQGTAKGEAAGSQTIERRADESETAELPVENPPPEVPAEDGGKKGKRKKAVKSAFGVLYAAVILGICIAPFAFLWSRPGGGTVENRSMASTPKLQTAEGLNWNYPGDAGAYFTDHFAFRQEMVALNSKIRAEIFGVSPVEDVIVGKNGWLYYTATLDDYQHKNSVSERMLFNMAHNTALMQEYSEGLGKTFLFTIAPNKNTLYDENMPDRLRFREAEKSDAERLVPWLVREEVNYVDLFGLFKEQDEVLYYARDSHWNEKGAVMVCDALLDAAGKPHETYEDLVPVQKADYFGDLGLMLFPVGGKPESRFQYPVPDTWDYAEGENVEDQFVRTINEEGEGNLLMYRDSFGNSLLPCMAQTFGQAVFSRKVPYPMSDLVTYEPDIVIVEKVERHLPTLGMVPPLMSAPIREAGEESIQTENSAATALLSKEGSYWKIEGVADPAYMDTDSRIYVEVDDGSGAKRYEAFCVSRSDAEDGSTNDYGYVLYISEIMVNGDRFHIQLMTEREKVMTILLEREIQG